jgi:precorrin-3B C17-methyltransferase
VRAVEVLRAADVVAGYTTYIDLVRSLIPTADIISTGMTKEVDRVEAALQAALDGRSCALISSGDPGIYAMAGLALEMCQQKGLPIHTAATPGPDAGGPTGLHLEVVPGIPALCAGAALLGAPLTHDFAVISLSDLLTPWERIEQRLNAAARADFVIAIYNPKSKRRADHLAKAQQILLKHRDPHTPVGVVHRAMRSGQHVEIVDLEVLDRAAVDMQTIVFVGSRTSVCYRDFMITPRGYARKYDLKAS